MQGPRRRLADLFDTHQRQLGECPALGVDLPFLRRSHHGHHQAGLGGGRLQILSLPSLQCPAYRVALVGAAEERQQAVTVVRKVGVVAHPATVASPVDAGDLVPQVGRWSVVDPEIALAAEFDGSVARIDANLLARPATQPPNLGRDQSRRRDGHLGRRSDPERRRQH